MKIDRLIGILSILLQKDKVTAAELSEKFEVSRRTIVRDIDDICKAGIPIVTTQGKGGGIQIMEGYKIDRTLLSNEDMNAILTGLKSLDSVSDSPNYKHLMDKLSVKNSEIPDFGDQIMIDLSTWDRSAISWKIEIIKTAIKKGETIAFKYYAPNGESARTIEPYHLIFQWSSWYVWGYCIARQDYRLFKLTRIFDLKNTGDKHQPREIPPYKCQYVWHAVKGITATVRFDVSVKWRILDEYGMELPRFNADGGIELTYTWSDKQNFFASVLRFGDKAEIVSPPELRKEFIELLKNISDIYKI